MSATSSSDRIQAAREALRLALSRQAHMVPGDCRECDDLDVYISALRALIEPPATEEGPAEIAERIMRDQVGDADRAVTYTTNGAEILDMIAEGVQAGTLAGWESWEPETANIPNEVYVIQDEMGEVIDVTDNQEWAEWMTRDDEDVPIRTAVTETIWSGPADRKDWK